MSRIQYFFLSSVDLFYYIILQLKIVDIHSGEIIGHNHRMAIETLHLITLYAILTAHFEFSIHKESMSLNVMN